MARGFDGDRHFRDEILIHVASILFL